MSKLEKYPSLDSKKVISKDEKCIFMKNIIATDAAKN